MWGQVLYRDTAGGGGLYNWDWSGSQGHGGYHWQWVSGGEATVRLTGGCIRLVHVQRYVPKVQVLKTDSHSWTQTRKTVLGYIEYTLLFLSLSLSLAQTPVM